MSSLETYLRGMARFGASGVILKSDENITFKFPAGDRKATQATSHDDLQQMVGAAAPSEVFSKLFGGEPAQFVFTMDGQAFEVAVSPSGGSWTVEMGGATGKTPSTLAPPPVDAIEIGEAGGNSPAVEATSFAGAAQGGMELGTAGTGPAPQTGLGAATRGPTGLAAAVPEPGPAPKPVSVAVATPSVPGPGSDAPFLEQLLYRMKELGASDLHLSSESKPFVREAGSMRVLSEFEVFTPESLQRYIDEISPEKNIGEFADRNDTDFAYNIEGLSRFRVNIFRDRKGPGAVLRAIPFEIPNAKQLGLPESVLELTKLTKGLVLVTGPTGSGKSTTLAALIDHINDTRPDHLITIEDPIEFVHNNKKCLVNQREVHTHTHSFKGALRAALREDPDIILVGEMRDLETIAIAVETAETGHLVFGTLHTSTAPGTVDRIIDQFPPDRQEQIRTMLAGSLKGVISQVLCKRRDKGRVAAHEILIGTPAVANLIRERKTFQLFSQMQTGKNVGMQTLNDSLIALVKKGVVDPMEAYMKAVNKSEFKNILGRSGITLSD